MTLILVGWQKRCRSLTVLLTAVTDNVCVDEKGHAVIIDFDAALPCGEQLLKGRMEKDIAVSSRDNDYKGLDAIEDFLLERKGDGRA